MQKLFKFLTALYFLFRRPRASINQSNVVGPNENKNIGSLVKDPFGNRWLIRHDGTRELWKGSTFKAPDEKSEAAALNTEAAALNTEAAALNTEAATETEVIVPVTQANDIPPEVENDILNSVKVPVKDLNGNVWLENSDGARTLAE